MRSVPSRTAPSGRPTVVVCGRPEDTSTSTSTTSASMPRRAPERTRASMDPACRARRAGAIARSGILWALHRGAAMAPGAQRGYSAKSPAAPSEPDPDGCLRPPLLRSSLPPELLLNRLDHEVLDPDVIRHAVQLEAAVKVSC